MAARRTRSLDHDLIDQYAGYDSTSGELIPKGSGLVNALAGMQRVHMNRLGQMGNPGARNFSTVLPSKMWDGFFGALQNRRDLVEGAGGRFDVDLGGDPSTGEGGIGRTKIMDLAEGSRYDVKDLRRQQALQGLDRATYGRRNR